MVALRGPRMVNLLIGLAKPLRAATRAIRLTLIGSATAPLQSRLRLQSLWVTAILRVPFRIVQRSNGQTIL